MDWKKQRFIIRSINNSNSENRIDKNNNNNRSKSNCYRMDDYKKDGDHHGHDGEGVAVSAECSMCGDVGLVRNLFRCNRCNSRYQHTYCSNWYPHERSIYIEVCNWCATEAMVKSSNTTLNSHPARHMDHGDNVHQNNENDGDNNNDKDDHVDMSMYSTPRRTHDHDNHSAHAHHRLIKKTSKRLVVRRYKFVSEV